MPRTADDTYEFFRNYLSNWNIQAIPTLTDVERDKIGVGYFRPSEASILITPEGEKIVVAFSGTSVTGTDRLKPQIRIFTNNLHNAFKYSKIKRLRFFSFVSCSTDRATLKFPPTVNPDDYIVSLETSFDRCGNSRIDIRSMYDTLETNFSKDYFRLSEGDHACSSIEQASFIRIRNASNLVLVNNLMAYLTYFDNRPYMLSAKEGLNVVYQPSALFEKAQNTDSQYPWNMLVFGAPGTGKSRLIENKLGSLKNELGEDMVISDRVTFYSDYTYQQFIGGYMPMPKANVQETIEVSGGANNYNGNIKGERITYEFVPGPFGSLLSRAYISKMKGENVKYILIIEELNRANAASVFGDMFQLLDRDKGVSNYYISISNAFAEYLFNTVYNSIKDSSPTEAGNLSVESFRNIKLPENLYIWSTMNSADQGVFPLDSAFKRRWSFIYKDINAISAEDANRSTLCLPDCSDHSNVHAVNYDWNALRKAINTIILHAGFDEDRCIGYWFFSEEEVVDIENHTNCVIKVFHGDLDAIKELETLPDPFMDKLLSYLRQDVFRNVPTQFFKEDCKTLSVIRLATNHLEINGRKPVSFCGDITLLPNSALKIVPVTIPVTSEGDTAL